MEAQNQRARVAGLSLHGMVEACCKTVWLDHRKANPTAAKKKTFSDMR